MDVTINQPQGGDGRRRGQGTRRQLPAPVARDSARRQERVDGPLAAGGELSRLQHIEAIHGLIHVVCQTLA